MSRPFPQSEIAGFTKHKGVPMGGKAYFSSWEEAIRRCRENPFCIGVTNQRIFVESKEPRGRIQLGKGQPGESHAFLKEEYEIEFCG
jgi:hypothetical protein